MKKAEAGRENSDVRDDLLKRLSDEKSREKTLSAQLKDYADNDPAVLEEMAAEAETALAAANRWTDNIFSIQSWIKNKFPSVDQSAMSKQFGIPEDLDYVE